MPAPPTTESLSSTSIADGLASAVTSNERPNGATDSLELPRAVPVAAAAASFGEPAPKSTSAVDALRGPLSSLSVGLVAAMLAPDALPVRTCCCTQALEFASAAADCLRPAPARAHCSVGGTVRTPNSSELAEVVATVVVVVEVVVGMLRFWPSGFASFGGSPTRSCLPTRLEPLVVVAGATGPIRNGPESFPSAAALMR